MRIGEIAQRAGVTTKAVRYYESVGLLSAARLPNGYRDYDEAHVRLVREVRALGELGIRAEQSRPFLDCLVAGHERGDDCAGSLEAYRATLADLDSRIGQLTARRAAVSALLAEADVRAAPQCEFALALALAEQ